MANLLPLERHAVPELEPLLGFAEQAMGCVPNSLLTMARWPELVRAFVPLAGLVNSPRRVGAELKSLVAFVSSRAAGCGYCQAHTSHGAERRGVDSEKLEAACDFESSARFGPAELAALRFARDASVSPAAVTADHFRALREHYDEDQIVEIAAVIGSTAGTMRSRRRSRTRLSPLLPSTWPRTAGTQRNTDRDAMRACLHASSARRTARVVLLVMSWLVVSCTWVGREPDLRRLYAGHAASPRTPVIVIPGCVRIAASRA
jgi:AhpD family alkylhydroperoxidase